MAQVKKQLNVDQVFCQNKQNIPTIFYSYLKTTEYNSDELYLLVCAQAQHETLALDTDANYKVFSPWYATFGMRPPKVRTTYMSGSVKNEGKYACYSNYADCIADLVEWWRMNKMPVTINNVSDYVSFLKSKNYFGGPEGQYRDGLNNALSKYGSNVIANPDKNYQLLKSNTEGSFDLANTDWSKADSTSKLKILAIVAIAITLVWKGLKALSK